MKKWKPINYEGTWYEDPRDELLARTRRAERGNDSYVAVPVELAIACALLRECDNETFLTSDEDGPMIPRGIKCRKPEDHRYMHSNGYVNWANTDSILGDKTRR